uniref:Uncharacterized protein n=1 Tax=Globodera rostochiensis TaxID=31243 RepID=A0A914HS24_GLORO
MPRSAQIGLRPRIFGFERVNNPADDHSKCADIDKQKINVLINATLIKETVPELIKLYVTNRVTQEHWRRRSWLGAEKPDYFASKHGTRNASEENFLDRAWKGGLLRTEKCHLGARL